MNDIIFIGDDNDDNCDYKINNVINNPSIMEKIGKQYKKIIYNAEEPLDWLPNGITHLQIINQFFDHPLNNLPQTLIYLCIKGYKLLYAESSFNQPLDYLPINLKCLILESLLDYTYSLDNLPPNLEYLYIILREYNNPLNNLPKSIHTFYKLNTNDMSQSIPEIDEMWQLVENL